MIHPQTLTNRLLEIAQEQNRPFNSCWGDLLLERFLARLASSVHADKFVFKGGFLLSYLMELGRETKDLDFLLTRLKAGTEELREIFEQIILVPSSDGFTFSFGSIELLSQPHMEYPGYRIFLNVASARVKGSTKDKIAVDVGVGDVVDQLTHEISLVHYRGKPFFESSISLQVYPPEFIFSEKLETAISKGADNSRMKDYHDLILLIRQKEMIHLDKLHGAIERTFSNRGTQLRPINFDKPSLDTIQKLWTAHLSGLGDFAQDLDLPQDFAVVLEEINKYILAVNEVANSKKG
ncbi:MAG TPA: nucleotidyl transferase AbiEii/AbiGii toxin family protein [Rhabdochlamydiaceae bacterium]